MKCLSALVPYLTLRRWISLPSFFTENLAVCKGSFLHVTVRCQVKVLLRILSGKHDATCTTRSLWFCKISPSLYAPKRFWDVQGTEEILKATSGNLSLFWAWVISIICMVSFKHLILIFCPLDLSKDIPSTRTDRKMLRWNCFFQVLWNLTGGI